MAVGVVNTGLTALIIFLLLWRDHNVYLANAAGYIAGIGVSFLLNSVFTFGVPVTASRLLRFLCICALSYLVNLFTLHLMYQILPEYRYCAQLVAMSMYTLSGFFLNKYWGMR
ncbi:GtrA family protein [Enterobacter sp. 22466]|uniref:GtrA family protein n=1 Tax=Enterobacter sp. 22466 TaxID=3453924 RepID=UPI003F82C6CB